MCDSKKGRIEHPKTVLKETKETFNKHERRKRAISNDPINVLVFATKIEQVLLSAVSIGLHIIRAL